MAVKPTHRSGPEINKDYQQFCFELGNLHHQLETKIPSQIEAIKRKLASLDAEADRWAETDRKEQLKKSQESAAKAAKELNGKSQTKLAPTEKGAEL